MVTFELYGTARLRAGASRLEVSTATLGVAIRALAAARPSLDGTVILGDRVHPAYRISLDGDRFISDPDTPLADGVHLLLISADAGG